ncbi:MAG TPA: hypothetical protein VFH10_04165 [Nocardioides sp.]|uniref:hypothetical protein n=1 Tax=Nocardioides sp. TaxID=35761 RepID=UPI002D7F3C6C|nr:hypothetical protein [Nocardioides sp.]HET6651814.1 hypothetical protein [Nocardioides sp.]
MEREVAAIAERLVEEFSGLPWHVVVDTVCDCAGECQEANPFFVEQAARATLVRQRQPEDRGTALSG